MGTSSPYINILYHVDTEQMTNHLIANIACNCWRSKCKIRAQQILLVTVGGQNVKRLKPTYDKWPRIANTCIFKTQQNISDPSMYLSVCCEMTDDRWKRIWKTLNHWFVVSFTWYRFMFITERHLTYHPCVGIWHPGQILTWDLCVNQTCDIIILTTSKNTFTVLRFDSNPHHSNLSRKQHDTHTMIDPLGDNRPQ